MRTRSHAGDARPLHLRYTTADLAVLDDAEAGRFLGDRIADPQVDAPLAWELLYRREPELYERLAAAERIHPAVLRWLPDAVERIVEVGAGTGRLTMELLGRARELVALEPAQPLRGILAAKLARAPGGDRARVAAGFFDDLPLNENWADLVVACSAFTPDAEHGGDAGLAEMERICRPGGRVAIVWPNHLDWLARRGYDYVAFAGETFIEFASAEEAVELAEIFYPHAAAEVRRRGERRVAFATVGVNAPRDVAFKAMTA